MSLYGVMRTGVSGMNAQSNKLGTIADNVSNAGTVGYKRATADFSSFVLDAGNTNYDSGAVVTTIDTMREEGLLANAVKVGDAIREGLAAALAGVAGVTEVRGMGLMIGVELDRPCGALVKMGLDAGLVFNVTAESVIRLLPALIITEAEGREILERLVPLVKAFLAQEAAQPKLAAAV